LVNVHTAAILSATDWSSHSLSCGVTWPGLMTRVEMVRLLILPSDLRFYHIRGSSSSTQIAGSMGLDNPM